jgi:uncharacterized protein (TIRG00374 family)
MVLAGLLLAVLHASDFERFVALVKGTEPAWFAVALLLQGATYAAAAAVWQRAAAATGYRLELRSLVPLGLAKLFTDQAFPSAGLSGTVLLARGLARRGIPASVAMEVLLVTLVSFYSAYLSAALLAVGVLWLHHEANVVLAGAVAVFALVAIAVPASVLWLKRWGTRSPPRWLERMPGIATLLANVGQARGSLLRNPGLLVESTLLQWGVFVLDALTLWAISAALAEPASFATVFVSFMMASIVGTIGLVPLGLGTFEATCIATLHLLGIEVEVAVAVTLLFRGLSFWLPMAPGLWLAHIELRVAEPPTG